jgi:hypothetical protein
MRFAGWQCGSPPQALSGELWQAVFAQSKVVWLGAFAGLYCMPAVVPRLLVVVVYIAVLVMSAVVVVMVVVVVFLMILVEV